MRGLSTKRVRTVKEGTLIAKKVSMESPQYDGSLFTLEKREYLASCNSLK